MSILNLTTPYEKKRIITYASDGIKAIYHNKDIQLIAGNVYKDKEEADQWGQIHCNLYCYFDNIKIGIDIGGMTCLNSREPEEMKEAAIRNCLDTTDNFIAMLDDNVINCRHIGNAQIELAKYIKPERVAAYEQARLDYRAMKDRQEEERWAKREAEDKAYCEQKNSEAEQTVNDTIQSIITGGKIGNIKITIYKNRYNSTTYSVFNYLAYQNNIEIPIKVRGWINNKLVNITIADGKMTSYQYQGAKGTHGSNTVWNYIQKVLDVIFENNCVA